MFIDRVYSSLCGRSERGASVEELIFRLASKSLVRVRGFTFGK